ncbi:unnamed protein product, partial [marine sediment metagenome]
MTKEMREYIKECDCEEIQHLWKPKNERGDSFYIPSLSWLKKKMGKKLRRLYTRDKVWICEYISSEWTFMWTVRSSPRLVCIEALKAINKPMVFINSNG